MLEAQFPLPLSGQIRLAPIRDGSFEIHCKGVDRKDAERLLGFFMEMRGRYGRFKFEFGGVLHEDCHFDSDHGPSISGADNQDIAFPIRAQPPS